MSKHDDAHIPASAPPAIGLHTRSLSRRAVQYLLLLALLLILLLASLIIGSVYISPRDLWAVFSGEGGDLLSQKIVWQLRLPRSIVAVLGSAALATAGLLMQTLFRNPLAGPSVLGLSAGSSLAVAMYTMGGIGLSLGAPGIMGTSISAMLGSLAVLLLIMAVARRFSDITSVLIVGLMFGFFTSAVVSLLQSTASESAIKTFVFWGFGSFSKVMNGELLFFGLPLLVAMLAAALLIKPLDALLLGERHAETVGVDTGRLRLHIVLITGILTGVVTAFCGPIAFIGLAAPHIARLLSGSVKHSLVMPLAWLSAAILGLLCDIIARWPFSESSIPLNAVCAMFGAPLVIYLIFAGRRKKWLI